MIEGCCRLTIFSASLICCYNALMNETISFPEDGHANCLELEDNSFWFRHRNQVIIEVMRQHPPSGPVYDVGGGNGYVSLGLQNAGFPVVLVEPGVAGVKNARARGITSIVPTTLDQSTIQDHSLDAVGIFDVLEHIEDETTFLSGIRHKLKPCGKLYITVPAYQFLWSYEDKVAGHFRRYTLDALTALLRQYGFAIEYSTYFFSFLTLPIYLNRTLPTQLGLKKSSTLEYHKRQHSNRPGLIPPLLDTVMKWELSQIKKRSQIPFGGSCLVSAGVSKFSF